MKPKTKPTATTQPKDWTVRMGDVQGATHSALPWQALDWMILCDKVNKYGNFYVAEVSPQFIDKADKQAKAEANQNLAFIVRACNNAQRLADALKAVTADIRNRTGSGNPITYGTLRKVSEALAEWSKAK